MRASMSAKKIPGGGSPIAKRCAFIGHLMNAENTAAVIDVLASIEADCAGVLVGTIYAAWPEGLTESGSRATRQLGIIRALPGRRVACHPGDSGLDWLPVRPSATGLSPSAADRRGGRPGWSRRIRAPARGR